MMAMTTNSSISVKPRRTRESMTSLRVRGCARSGPRFSSRILASVVDRSMREEATDREGALRDNDRGSRPPSYHQPGAAVCNRKKNRSQRDLHTSQSCIREVCEASGRGASSPRGDLAQKKSDYKTAHLAE